MLCYHCLQILNVYHGPNTSVFHWASQIVSLVLSPLPNRRLAETSQICLSYHRLRRGLLQRWMEWRITEQLLAFKLPHFWDLFDASVYVPLPCHNTKGTEKWEQGPLRALLVALKLHYSAFIFLSCMNSKSSSKIRLWGSAHLNFSQIWLSVRTQQKMMTGKVTK